MIKSTFIVVLGLLLFLPAAQAGEKFEFVHCYSGTWTPMHENKDMPYIDTYKLDGIIMSKSENKFLANASTHCEGIGIGQGPKAKVTSYCIAIDPDGDMLMWGGPRKEGVIEREFGQGTGKYKGIKGNHRSERIAAAKKPLKPRTFQECRNLTGTIELSPK
jgi:hypothetical protein